MEFIPSIPNYVVCAIKKDDVLVVRSWMESRPNNPKTKELENGIVFRCAVINGAELMVEYLLKVGITPSMAEGLGYGFLCSSIMTTLDSSLVLKEEVDKYFRIAEKVLERGANVNGTIDQGVTPLYRASKKGLTKFIDLFVRFGADMSSRTSAGMTPFLVAAQNAKRDAMEQLKNLGADIHAVNCNNGNAVHLSVRSPETVKLLISWGVKHDSPDVSGWTPLLLACQTDSVETVRVFLNNGVDTSRKFPFKGKPEENLTVLDVCRHRRHKVLIEMIEAYNEPDIKEPEQD